MTQDVPSVSKKKSRCLFFYTNKTQLCRRVLSLASGCVDTPQATVKLYFTADLCFRIGQTELQMCDSVCLCECSGCTMSVSFTWKLKYSLPLQLDTCPMSSDTPVTKGSYAQRRWNQMALSPLLCIGTCLCCVVYDVLLCLFFIFFYLTIHLFQNTTQHLPGLCSQCYLLT